MPYYMDASKVTIQDLLMRVTGTDLVPSRRMLLQGIEENFQKLIGNGIFTLAELRKTVRNPKYIGLLAETTNIEVEYLTLLRREVESYFPKPFPLRDFGWLDQDQLKKLVSQGYKNTALLYDTLEVPGKRQELIESIGLEEGFVDEIFPLVSLTRIQWVSPIFAKILVAAGYKNAGAIAAAEAEDLHRAIESINDEGQYFKGKIGLRDIKRLIKAASYVV